MRTSEKVIDEKWPILPRRDLRQAYYEADYYGASQLVAELAGVTAYRNLTPWNHGVHTLLPPSLSYYLREYREGFGLKVLTHREDQAAQLVDQGIESLAVGAPFCYVSEQGLTRKPRSVLFFARHSAIGLESSNARETLEVISRLKERFETVVVSLHGECAKRPEVTSLYDKHQVSWVLGADINDFNSLRRMRCLFESFEYVATDTFGSHLAYAAFAGARLMALEPWQSLSHEDAVRTVKTFKDKDLRLADWLSEMHTWANVSDQIPWFGPEMIEESQRQDQERWARQVLGYDCLLPPEDLVQEFSWDFGSRMREFFQVRIPARLKSLTR